VSRVASENKRNGIRHKKKKKKKKKRGRGRRDCESVRIDHPVASIAALTPVEELLLSSFEKINKV
jgi:hypothetical protein